MSTFPEFDDFYEKYVYICKMQELDMKIEELSIRYYMVKDKKVKTLLIRLYRNLLDELVLCQKSILELDKEIENLIELK